jgi:hypothetical protein
MLKFVYDSNYQIYAVINKKNIFGYHLDDKLALLQFIMSKLEIQFL